MSDLIMAVDLSPFKCVVCLYPSSSPVKVFRTIDTDRELERSIRGVIGG